MITSATSMEEHQKYWNDARLFICTKKIINHRGGN